MRLNIVLTLLTIVSSGAVYAGDDGGMSDSIVVTGSRISYRDLLETPAISITKPGDYLLQSITLVNDTRDKEARKKELHATIEKLLARAGNRYQIQYEDGYRTTLDKSNYMVDMQDEGKRPDSSKIRLQLRMELVGNTTQGELLIHGMRDFVKQSPKIGRTEIDLDTETSIGMNKPERYRYELIDAISSDSKKIANSMGAGCKVELDGLNSRIEWRRVGAIELLLYVPYTMKVNECQSS